MEKCFSVGGATEALPLRQTEIVRKILIWIAPTNLLFEVCWCVTKANVKRIIWNGNEGTRFLCIYHFRDRRILYVLVFIRIVFSLVLAKRIQPSVLKFFPVWLLQNGIYSFRFLPAVFFCLPSLYPSIYVGWCISLCFCIYFFIHKITQKPKLYTHRLHHSQTWSRFRKYNQTHRTSKGMEKNREREKTTIERGTAWHRKPKTMSTTIYSILSNNTFYCRFNGAVHLICNRRCLCCICHHSEGFQQIVSTNWQLIKSNEILWHCKWAKDFNEYYIVPR